MSSMKRVRLAVMFVIAVALVAGTSAGARSDGHFLKTRLTPPSGSDEPNAMGAAEFSGTWGWNAYSGWFFHSTLKVTGKGLMTGEIYTFGGDPSSASRAASARGTWSDEDLIYFDGMVYVSR